MRALVQRANGASVTVDGITLGGFTGSGLVVFLGVTHSDTQMQVDNIVRKITRLQIMNDVPQSVLEIGAPVLLISQFTLYGSTKKGKKPSWTAAAPAEVAEPLYQAVIEGLRKAGLTVYTGQFGADMQISLTNDGPFTLLLESENKNPI